MVVRFWSARTTQVRFSDYLRHFQEHVLPRLRRVDGYLEARVLSQSDGVVVQFIVETLWASAAAVESASSNTSHTADSSGAVSRSASARASSPPASAATASSCRRLLTYCV